MSMITTAVIPVAGAGSRVFPLTTAIEKCMLPIYAGGQSKPLVDFMVQDCVQAGVKRIIFVTTERGRQQLQDYFGPIPQTLRSQLEYLGKHELLAQEAARRQAYGAEFVYIIQPAGVYGTTVPLALAQPFLAGEKYFALMGGDDFVWHADPTRSELADAIQTWQQAGTDHVIMGNPVSRHEATRYGVLQLDAHDRLLGVDEKPPLQRVPESPLVNISRYLLSDAIWPFVAAEMRTPRGPEQPEHYITYVIDAAVAAGQSFQAHRISGDYLDGGSLHGLQTAGLHIAAHSL